MLSMFDLSKVKNFTAELVDDLHRIKANGIARRDKPAQINKRFEKTINAAIEFEQEQKLNVYKKAQFLILVRSGLASKAWSKDDIERVVQQLLTRRLQKPAKPASTA